MCESRIQLKLALTLLVTQAVLCGCAHQYLMEFKNGDKFISFSKPKLQEASYHFTDEAGVHYVVPKDRVVKIKNVWLVREEAKPAAPAKPTKPKHWYFLWLA
jgi:hypothetical protein